LRRCWTGENSRESGVGSRESGVEYTSLEIKVESGDLQEIKKSLE